MDRASRVVPRKRLPGWVLVEVLADVDEPQHQIASISINQHPTSMRKLGGAHKSCGARGGGIELRTALEMVQNDVEVAGRTWQKSSTYWYLDPEFGHKIGSHAQQSSNRQATGKHGH